MSPARLALFSATAGRPLRALHRRVFPHMRRPRLQSRARQADRQQHAPASSRSGCCARRSPLRGAAVPQLLLLLCLAVVGGFTAADTIDLALPTCSPLTNHAYLQPLVTPPPPTWLYTGQPTPLAFNYSIAFPDGAAPLGPARWDVLSWNVTDVFTVVRATVTVYNLRHFSSQDLALTLRGSLYGAPPVTLISRACGSSVIGAPAGANPSAVNATSTGATLTFDDGAAAARLQLRLRGHLREGVRASGRRAARSSARARRLRHARDAARRAQGQRRRHGVRAAGLWSGGPARRV